MIEPSLYDEMRRDFLAIREEVPAFLMFGDEKVRAIVAPDTQSDDLQLGGFAPRHSLLVRILREDMPSALSVGRQVKVEGAEASYRVESVSIRPGAPIVSVNLIQV